MRPLGWAPIQCDWCPWRKRKFGYVKRQEVHMHRGTTTCGHRKRQVSASQGERPQKKGNLLTSWSWTSCLQNCDKLNLRCLSHSIYVFFFFYDVPIRLKVCFYQKLCFLPLLLFGFSLSHRKTQFEESITKSFTLKYTWQRDLEMSPFSGLSCHLNLTSLLWVPGLKI